MPYLVFVATPSLGEVQSGMSRMVEDITQATLDGIYLTVRFIESRIKFRLSGPVLRVQTTMLRASWFAERLPDGSVVFFDSDRRGVEYARAHEFGVARGTVTIRPSHKKALSFMVEGTRVTVRSVQMYLPERPYFRPSVAEGIEALPNFVGDRLRLVGITDAYISVDYVDDEAA